MNFPTSILILIAFFTLSGCAVNPVTGKTELSLISESSEIAMGLESYTPSQQAQGGLYLADPSIQEYVNSVGQRVAEQSDRTLPFEFVVLNNSVPNAWALPGGKIAINRGLLLELDSEAELAAVLGHEAVHSAAKHGANAVQRGSILQGLVLATAFGTSQAGYGDYSEYIVGSAQVGVQLISQRYGRSAELEADYYGIKYMAKAGYEPRAAIRLQETFVKLSEGQKQNWVQGLFSSHPPSQSRVDANRETISSLSLASGDVGHDRYLMKISTLIETKPAYDNFDRALSYMSVNEMSKASSTIEKAIEIVPNEARFLGLLGDIHYRQEKYLEASDDYSRAIAADPNYYEYPLGRGLSYHKQGKGLAAKVDLERSNQLLPTAIANHALGELSLQEGDRQNAKAYFQIAMAAKGELGSQAAKAFSELDLPENPGRYLSTEVGLDKDGLLVARVRNNSPIDLSHVAVEFGVNAGERRLVKTVPLKALTAGEIRLISSGWQLSSAEATGQLSATIVSAEI